MSEGFLGSCFEFGVTQSICGPLEILFILFSDFQDGFSFVLSSYGPYKVFDGLGDPLDPGVALVAVLACMGS